MVEDCLKMAGCSLLTHGERHSMVTAEVSGNIGLWISTVILWRWSWCSRLIGHCIGGRDKVFWDVKVFEPLVFLLGRQFWNGRLLSRDTGRHTFWGHCWGLPGPRALWVSRGIPVSWLWNGSPQWHKGEGCYIVVVDVSWDRALQVGIVRLSQRWCCNGRNSGHDTRKETLHSHHSGHQVSGGLLGLGQISLSQ